MSAIGTGEKIGLTPMVGLLGRSRPWYAIGCIEPKDLLQRGWVVKSLANRQVITRARSLRGKFLPVTKQGGEWVKMGRKPSKTAGLIAANST